MVNLSDMMFADTTSVIGSVLMLLMLLQLFLLFSCCCFCCFFCFCCCCCCFKAAITTGESCRNGDDGAAPAASAGNDAENNELSSVQTG